SIAESIEAMNAVAVAGLDRIRMREALAATIIKDEADRPLFDAHFESFFGTMPRRRGDDWNRPGTESSIAPGAARMQGETPLKTRGDDKEQAGSAGTPEPSSEALTLGEQDSEEAAAESEKEIAERAGKTEND